MNCPKCKNPVDETHQNCEWCGAKIHNTQPGKVHFFSPEISQSIIDEKGNYVTGQDMFQSNLIEKYSNFPVPALLSDHEKKCPKCQTWLIHYCYGKFSCYQCEFEYVHSKEVKTTINNNVKPKLSLRKLVLFCIAIFIASFLLCAILLN